MSQLVLYLLICDVYLAIFFELREKKLIYSSVHNSTSTQVEIVSHSALNTQKDCTFCEASLPINRALGSFNLIQFFFDQFFFSCKTKAESRAYEISHYFLDGVQFGALNFQEFLLPFITSGN